MDSHEIRKRQQRRALERQKRLEKQRKLRKRLLVSVFAAVSLVIICLCITLFASLFDSPAPEDNNTVSTESTTAPNGDTVPTEPTTVINLAFGGDINVTNQVVEAGSSADGYNYTNVFRDILPALADADHTVVNFEGNLCGAPYGTAKASAPQSLMSALSSAGVDMVQVANSYSIYNGIIGLDQTIEGIRKAGMEPVGAYATEEEAQQSGGFSLRNIRGVKVAFVAFTKGMDSMSLPEGKESCVNVLYEDYTSTYQSINTENITRVLDNVAAAEPDITIALLHWGSEYNSQISSSQKQIVSLLQKNGVDAIIGTHSHYVQEIEYDEQTGALVAYSLGDLLGDADRTRTAYSIVLNLQVTKDNVAGTTKISGYDYIPVYIHHQTSESGTKATQLLRMPQAIREYEEKGMNMVAQDVYDAMKAAISRLEKLFAPADEN